MTLKTFIVLILLISSSISCELKDVDYNKMLLDASLSGDRSKVEEALKNGAYVKTVDINGYSPLLYASKYNFIDVIKVLVENHADVNVVGGTYDTSSGCTSLMYTSLNDNIEATKLLVTNGAKVNT